MNRHRSPVLCTIISCISLFGLVSCGSFRSEINDQLTEALVDCRLDATECQGLEKLLLENRKDARKLNLLSSDEASVNREALQNYVTASKAYRQQQRKCSDVKLECGQVAEGKIIEPKLYLENSAGMKFYDRPQSKGQFKDALATVLNNFSYLKPEHRQIYVVNDAVYPCNLSFARLVQEKDLFRLPETSQGNAAYTDFERIFRSILDSLQEGEIALLVSDLIYSTKDMKEQNPAKILRAAENLTSNVFGNYAKDYSTLVLKLNADYIGPYYPYKGKGISYTGTRPYYICFFGRNGTMETFLTSEKYASVRDFHKLPEFENFYYFNSNSQVVSPYYTVILGEGEGRFNQDNDEKKETKEWVHTLESVTPDRTSDKLAIHLAADFSKLTLPADYLEEPKNYVVESPDSFRVAKVERIRDKNFYPGSTHKLILSSNNPRKSGKREVRVHLKKDFPLPWIEQSHSEDDLDVNSADFAQTTFGFQNMMLGIYKAYNQQDQEAYCTLKITLKP